MCIISGNKTPYAPLPHTESCCMHSVLCWEWGVRGGDGVYLSACPTAFPSPVRLWWLIMDGHWAGLCCALTHGWVSSPSFRFASSCSPSSWAQLSKWVSQLCKQQTAASTAHSLNTGHNVTSQTGRKGSMYENIGRQCWHMHSVQLAASYGLQSEMHHEIVMLNAKSMYNTTDLQLTNNGWIQFAKNLGRINN